MGRLQQQVGRLQRNTPLPPQRCCLLRTPSVSTTPATVCGTVGRPGVLASVERPVKAASPPSTAAAAQQEGGSGS